MFGKLLAQTTILINSFVLLLGEYRFIHMSLKRNNTLLLKREKLRRHVKHNVGNRRPLVQQNKCPKTQQWKENSRSISHYRFNNNTLLRINLCNNIFWHSSVFLQGTVHSYANSLSCCVPIYSGLFQQITFNFYTEELGEQITRNCKWWEIY